MVIDVKGMTPLLSVFDMPTSIEFYRDVLGFEIVSTSRPGDDFGWALLRYGEVELMLNTAYDDGERPPVPDGYKLSVARDAGNAQRVGAAVQFAYFVANARKSRHDEGPRPTSPEEPKAGVCPGLGGFAALVDPLFDTRHGERNDASHLRLFGRSARQPHR